MLQQFLRCLPLALVVMPLTTPAPAAAIPQVSMVRAPGGGIQPQAVVDTQGILHLIYYKGDPGHGDIFYVRSHDGGAHFSAPLRVNSQPGSAIAMGNIRGAQIAVGPNGRVHVAWNGSDVAQPRLRQDHSSPFGNYNSPMLYTRLNDAHTAFEPQRNLMRSTYGLDGGGSVAADALGNVYVAWHGGGANTKDETDRRVWIARSSNDGKSFAAETPAWNQPTGACGCCGLRIFADPRGDVYLLYRSAIKSVERNMYLLSARRAGIFTGTEVGRWHIEGCPMSSESFSLDGAAVVGAWETKGQVYFARIDPRTLKPAAAVAAPGSGKRQHPAVAANRSGQVILAWTDGMGWGRGGTVAWQVFDAAGQPIPGASGSEEGVPAWSVVSAFARPDGTFAVVY